MNLKALFVTVLLLLVAAGAAFWLRRPAPPPVEDARTGQPLLDASLVTRADRVVLSDQGKAVELARQPDGSWRVASYYDFPADVAKLGTMMTDLTNAKIKRLVTTRPDRLDRLEFKDATIKLLEKEQPIWSLTLGKTAAYGDRYVRFASETKGYEAALNLWLDTDAKNWANSTLLSLKADEVARIELSLPDGTTLAAHRSKAGEAWTADKIPADHVLDASKVDSLLGDFTHITFNDTSDLADPKAVAARNSSRTITLVTFAGTRYVVAVGRKPEEKKPKPPAAATTVANEARPVVSPADESKPAEPAVKPSETKPAETKPAQPEFETIPAGPVYAFITSSEKTAVVNQLMAKRAFQVSDRLFTELPAKSDDWFKTVPPPPKPPVTATPTPAK